MTKRKSGNYEVGYGKPPRERRFKPGRSGNPRGRPKKCPTMLELFAHELKRTRTIVEDGQRLRIQTDKILVKRIVDLALKANVWALRTSMAVIEQVREIEGAKLERDCHAMTTEELITYYNRLREIRPADHARIKKIKGSFP
ncbi:DUF5681 domain-containing protein [Bradyrhizobium lupini]|uniref:DUF5681 domain-containing protein n=1 Tax=Rhizobium lupini TaxID=136996 RepID=UPI0034C6583F